MKIFRRIFNYFWHVLSRSPTLQFPTVTRIVLDSEMVKLLNSMEFGVVLDAGSGWLHYKSHIKCKKYLTLDINEKLNPDICCDIQDIKWKSGYFDAVISTEVLEHVPEPQKAVNEIHRVLKKGGMCILSTRFIFPYHAFPRDYYRFTNDSLSYLFRKFRKVEIVPHGTRMQAVWQLASYGRPGLLLNILNPFFAKFGSKSNVFAGGYIVKAVK